MAPRRADPARYRVWRHGVARGIGGPSRVATRPHPYAHRCLGLLYWAGTWIWFALEATHDLAIHQVSIVGYRRLRRTRASAVRNGQWMPFGAALRASAHAGTCAGTEPAASERSTPVRPCGANGRAEAETPTVRAGPGGALGGRKRPVKRGVGMSVQRVADPDQALGLAVARRIREGLPLMRPVHARAPGGSVGRAPLAQRLREQQRVQGPRRAYA